MRGTTSRTLGLLIVVGLGHCVPTALGTDRAVPNDPAFLCQWGLENTGQLADCDVPIPAGRIEADIDALGAWSMHTGAKPIIVAVLGQGISPHPEFENRLLPGFATIGDPYDTWDLGERGSLVAGIIAAGRDNGMGVAGLNDAVRLLPVRVFNANSATTQSAQAQGVRWAVDQGAEIIVVLSQLVAGSDVFAEAIAYAAANDVLILAAAGDDGTGDQVYPAAYAECIGVAATTNTDARAPFSNSGAHVDLAAPGELVYSTTPAGEYATKWGTALAAGYVAGAASLIRSYGAAVDRARGQSHPRELRGRSPTGRVGRAVRPRTIECRPRAGGCTPAAAAVRVSRDAANAADAGTIDHR